MSDPPRIETDGYTKTDEWTEVAFDAPFITVKSHNAVYERPTFRDRIADLLPTQIDQSPRAVFTTGLSFDPPLPGSETPEKLLGVASKYASREFRKSLTEDGLLDVTQTGSKDLRLRGRRTAKAFQYDAGYPLNPEAIDATDPPQLSVRVWAAIWPTADVFEMGGGIYPLEDLSTALDRIGTGAAVEITSQPGGDRREVFDRIREAADD